MLGNEGFYPEAVAWSLTILFPWLNLLSVLIVLENSNIISKNLFWILLNFSFVFWIYTFVYYIVKRKFIHILKEQKELEGKRKYSNIIFYTYLLVTGVVYFYFTPGLGPCLIPSNR